MHGFGEIRELAEEEGGWGGGRGGESGDGSEGGMKPRSSHKYISIHPTL